MDYAAPPNKDRLWSQRKRSEDADLDRGVGLRLAGHRPETAGDQIVALQLSTDSESHSFRDNAHCMGL